MTTFMTTETVEAEAQVEPTEATPGCGCCIPPPDAVADKLAVLQARREALERRLAGLTG